MEVKLQLKQVSCSGWGLAVFGFALIPPGQGFLMLLWYLIEWSLARRGPVEQSCLRFGGVWRYPMMLPSDVDVCEAMPLPASDQLVQTSSAGTASTAAYRLRWW